ncbi:hypothetical protein HS088_TW10G00314 [Tripterygium wilfordii]|uniref:Uncharacterized protein n=1 Tax=Tripterygium wilfordii TaxID=458696 RepID=A0A7J7D4W6_TRIWF|nr:hypothetical protein HS088_TW10G00314 [Tripterygium wilfordii]
MLPHVAPSNPIQWLANNCQEHGQLVCSLGSIYQKRLKAKILIGRIRPTNALKQMAFTRRNEEPALSNHNSHLFLHDLQNISHRTFLIELKPKLTRLTLPIKIEFSYSLIAGTCKTTNKALHKNLLKQQQQRRKERKGKE